MPAARSSATQLALRCRAVGTCFSQHATEQNRSFIRPALHEATEQRYAGAPRAISLRHVAQTMLDIAVMVHDARTRRDLPSTMRIVLAGAIAQRAASIAARAAIAASIITSIAASLAQRPACSWAGISASRSPGCPRLTACTSPARSITTRCGSTLTL